MSSSYVVVPVFNGASSISNFLDKIDNEWLDRLIFVDDGSSDGTGEILKELNYTILNHEQNQGKGAAIQTALHFIKKKGGGQATTIDIDLQHPPEQLNDFNDVSEETILLGYRNNRRNMPILRQFSNFVTSLLVSVRSGVAIKDSQCGYRSFNTKLFDQIECVESGFQFESEMLMKASLKGWKVEHIAIPTIYGAEGSAIKNIKDTVKFVSLWFKSFIWT